MLIEGRVSCSHSHSHLGWREASYHNRRLVGRSAGRVYYRRLHLHDWHGGVLRGICRRGAELAFFAIAINYEGRGKKIFIVHFWHCIFSRLPRRVAHQLGVTDMINMGGGFILSF